MTGKEALEEIKDFSLAVFDEDGEEEDCIKFGQSEPNLIEPIERDLEILEILKKYLRVNHLIRTDALDNSIYLDLMLKDDADKIKEWLKNETN